MNMNRKEVLSLLHRVSEGKLSPREALAALKYLPFHDLGFAKSDTHRTLRKGFPEVIFCEGKDPSQVAKIAASLYGVHPFLLATRVSEETFRHLKGKFSTLQWFPQARALIIGKDSPREKKEGIVIVTAGTSDIRVAEEAWVTAHAMGNNPERLYDVGVAGIHRLISSLPKIQKARVIIAVAGMEGALASVLGGLVDLPIVAVPTSIGYGASFQGLSALLGMLNTCAPGVAVVNIDNGFGAGYLASLINHPPQEKEHAEGNGLQETRGKRKNR